MRWDELKGHQQQKRWFEIAMRNGRLGSSYLFVGDGGIGKRQFALLLAKSLFCSQTPSDVLDCCNACEDCAQVDAATHPDLIQVSKPPEKAFIPIELLIGEREKRMREGLCHDISLKPFRGQRKVAILDDADNLNAEGANSLLKTLEEPPADSLLILVGTSLQRQLTTIRSRCQAILFQSLSDAQIVDLIEQGAVAGTEELETVDPSRAQAVAALSHGSLEQARLHVESELQEFRATLIEQLSAKSMAILALIKEFTAVVDAAGKDARLRRDRMKILFQMAADFYRHAILSTNANDTEAHLRCWNRCLLAIEQVDRNANQAALIESWTYDLASFSRS